VEHTPTPTIVYGMIQIQGTLIWTVIQTANKNITSLAEATVTHQQAQHTSAIIRD